MQEGVRLAKKSNLKLDIFAISRFAIIDEIAFGIDENLERKCILQR